MKKTIAGKMEEISWRLRGLGDPFSQYDYLLTEGMGRKASPEIHKDAFRIGGCRTVIWSSAEERDGRVIFRADSDSLLVKGVLSLFDELYDGIPAAEAASCEPAFLKDISDEVIYPEIKENGLQKCYEKIRMLSH